MRSSKVPAAGGALLCAALLVSLAGCDAAGSILRKAQAATTRVATRAASAASSAAASAAADAATSAATAAVATVRSGDERTSTFEWNGPIEAGKTLSIRGINGGITARLSSGRTATVHATLTGHDSDPTEVKVEVVKEDGDVTLCAVYPDSFGHHNTCDIDGSHQEIHHNDVRVEFEVGVPAGVHFVPHTVNGEITADGLQGPVEARTVNGRVRLATTGWADAKTVNGSIHVTLGSTDAPHGLDFKTVNGQITLDLPSNAAADVDVSTVTGGISTDFPLTIRGRFMRHHASGTIGGGGPSLNLKTVSGGIELRRGS